MQHADHFTRILNERESFRKDKFSESSSENNSQIDGENIGNSDKDLVQNTNDEPKDKKIEKIQPEIN